MAATAEDQSRLLIAIEATQRRFEKQMSSVARSAGGTAKKIEDDFKKANDNVARGFESGGQKTVQSLGAQKAAAQNLSFQLNDIATQLAAGTSPFTIMAQQGGQVAQIINGAGGLRGALGALGGALGGLINPAGLVSIALIGAAGYAVQYFAEVVSGGEASEETLKKQADLIQKVADKYGDQIPILKEYAAELKLAADQTERLEGIRLTKEGLATELLKEFQELTEAQRDAISLVPEANQLYGVLAAKMESGAAETSDFQRVIDALNAVLANNTSPAITAARDALIGMRDASAETAGKAKELDKAASQITLTFGQAKDVAAALTSQMAGLGPQGAGAISEVASSLTSQLIPALGKAVDRMAELIKNYGTLQSQINQVPLGQIPPVYSGGGNFLNPDQLNTFNAQQADLQTAGSGAAASLIKGFEGFITKSKFDVNHFRVGFGSDTATRANGQIEEVTKDTVVTLEDAQRDLSRRIVEFQTGIQRAIGSDTWRALSEGQQAALTSIAYNYGQLPKSIVEAIQSGGGPQVVAQAIANLSSNPGRRKQEAQTYLSGTGISMSEAGLRSKKSPADVFQGNVDQVQKRIDVLTAEYEAQARLNPLIKDYGYAVEKARVEQELLSQAQAAGVEITPALREKISGLADAYAHATSASEQLKQSQQRTIQAAQEFASVGKDVVGGFISDLRSGKSATEALGNALNKLADKFIDGALDGILGGGPGGGGLFGSLFSGFLGGGGTDKWAGLRLAGGGRVRGPGGPTGDKIPAMLSDGEHVTNAKMANKYGSLLDAINADRLPHFAKGGTVSLPTLRTPRVPTSGGYRSGAGAPAIIRGGDVIVQGDVSERNMAAINRAIASNNKALAYARENEWR